MESGCVDDQPVCLDVMAPFTIQPTARIPGYVDESLAISLDRPMHLGDLGLWKLSKILMLTE